MSVLETSHTMNAHLLLFAAATLAISSCVVTPVTPVTTMTTNDSIRGRPTAESTRRWNQFLRIPGPAIYIHPDGVTYKTADNQLSSQVQDVPDAPQQAEVCSAPRQAPTSGLDTYTDSEGNGHTVQWDTSFDGSRTYNDVVTSPISGGRYDNNGDTTRTYITAP